MGKINNEKATMLFDSKAEVSIVDKTFARRIECVGIEKNIYMKDDRTNIKITLNRSLIYCIDAWVGDQVAILGMVFYCTSWNSHGSS